MADEDQHELHPICAFCGAPCRWALIDRVAVGSERLIFAQRQLSCEECGRSSAPAYFPWRGTTSHLLPISIIEALALGCDNDAEEL